MKLNHNCMEKEIFIKTDDRVINMQYIHWVKKFTECMEVCTKSEGCVLFKDTHRVCKETSPISYNRLSHLFENKQLSFDVVW